MNKSKLIVEMTPVDAVSIFRETAKGSGSLLYDSHEAYNKEIEDRIN
jgi:hypothetical protein